MRRSSVVLYLAVFLILCCGCGDGERFAAAEAAVKDFHERFNEQRYDAIFEDTHSGFKAKTSKAEFTKLMDAIHRKLGNTVDAQRTGWKVERTNMQVSIVIGFKTKYVNGEAVETFVYRQEAAAQRLFAYNMDSPVVTTK